MKNIHERSQQLSLLKIIPYQRSRQCSALGTSWVKIAASPMDPHPERNIKCLLDIGNAHKWLQPATKQASRACSISSSFISQIFTNTKLIIPNSPISPIIISVFIPPGSILQVSCSVDAPWFARWPGIPQGVRCAWLTMEVMPDLAILLESLGGC